MRSLNNFKNALAIGEADFRSKEVLKNVKSLIQEIEVSYDLLYEPQIRDFRELHEKIAPLIVHANFYESVISVLKCIEKSDKLLKELPEEYNLIRETENMFERFKDSISSLAHKSLYMVNTYLRSVNLYPKVSLLVNRSISDLLERYYVPKLVERKGYIAKSRMVNTSIGSVQLDVRAEKDAIVGFENLERLKGREVILVEVKTTVKREHISELSKKSKAILEIYQKDSKLWNYELRTQTWLVACYGWNEEIKSYAKREGIFPIDKEELEAQLQRYNLLDRSRPPCPKQ